MTVTQERMVWETTVHIVGYSRAPTGTELAAIASLVPGGNFRIAQKPLGPCLLQVPVFAGTS